MTNFKRLGPIVVISALITLLAGAALATPSTTDFVGKLLAHASFGQLHAQHDGVKVDTRTEKLMLKSTRLPSGRVARLAGIIIPVSF